MAESEAAATVREIERVVDAIRPLLAGRDPRVQGAALADLTAIWLAGHVIPGNRDATLGLRARLLVTHGEKVMELVEVNAKIMGTDG